MLHSLLNISSFETISLSQYFCVSPELILVLISLLSLHKKDFIVFLPFQNKHVLYGVSISPHHSISAVSQTNEMASSTQDAERARKGL